MKNTKESGYVGLIILLISVAAIALIFVFTVLNTDPKDGTIERYDSTDYERARQDIENAKNVKDKVDSTTEELNDFMNGM